MGNCQSLVLKDQILYFDQIIKNDPLLNLGRNKEDIGRGFSGTYLGMRAIKKFSGERIKLQTGKWWRDLF